MVSVPREAVATGGLYCGVEGDEGVGADVGQC